MKTYRVRAKMTTYCYIDVEAESADDARSKAEDIDGGEFITDDDPYSGGFEIERADELEA